MIEKEESNWTLMCLCALESSAVDNVGAVRGRRSGVRTV